MLIKDDWIDFLKYELSMYCYFNHLLIVYMKTVCEQQ